jgi:excinuclease UvrABC nuclease subunit
VATPHDILDGGAIEFSPEDDPEAFLKRVPARWVVYLLADAVDRPVQLLCVRNLRYSLKRRLGGSEQVGPSKRVNYRDLVRRIYWRRVDSAFEADWIYYEAARRLFPDTYQGMVGFRPAWFVHVNPDANFPRYTKTIDPTTKTGVLLGPLEDKHAAARLMQLAEDAFDLCRYYNILVEAPRAKACAYKEMGKCPAPCDGSISMEQYRRMIEWSAAVVVDPAEFVAEQTWRMQAAAADLRFESAAKIKAYADQVSQFGKGPFRHVRRLEQFQYVSLQRGPREGTAKVFLITPGEIEEVAGLVAEPVKAADVLRVIVEGAWSGRTRVDATGAERIGIVAHHLFLAKQTSGVFLRVDALDDKTLARGFRELQKQKVRETGEEEGLVKELQAM